MTNRVYAPTMEFGILRLVTDKHNYNRKNCSRVDLRSPLKPAARTVNKFGRTKFKISGVLFNLLGLYQPEITLNIWYVLSGGNRNAEPHQDGDF
jgi:hypothetical protein